AAKDSDPAELLSAYGRAFLFVEHPYGRPIHGSERSLAAIQPRDITEYYRAHFGADRTVLVFTGDIDVSTLKRQVRKTFGGWSRAHTPAPKLTEPARATSRRVLLVDSPG